MKFKKIQVFEQKFKKKIIENFAFVSLPGWSRTLSI